MKHIFLLGNLFLISIIATAQAPTINWQKSWGAAGNESITKVSQTKDGNYFIKSSNLILFDSLLVQLWEKSGFVAKLDNGNFIQKTTNGYLEKDINNTVVDSIVRPQSYQSGLTTTISIYQFGQIYKGGGDSKIISAVVSYFDYDRPQDKTNYYQMFYVYDSLNKQVDEFSVGSCFMISGWLDKSHSVYNIIESKDGETFVLGTTKLGTTLPNSSNYFVKKLKNSTSGTWFKNIFEGNGGINSIIRCNDGGYFIVGYKTTNSTDDARISKVSSIGVLEWEKTYGGAGKDSFEDIIKNNDGTYFLVGQTESSAQGDTMQNKGGTDAWIVQIDASGKVLWEKTYGGSLDENFSSINRTKDGSLIVGGKSKSSDQDLTANAGGSDYWMVNFKYLDLSTNTVNVSNFSPTIHPNPSTGIFYHNNLNDAKHIVVYDITGKMVLNHDLNANNTQIDLSNSPSGVYFYTLNHIDGNTTNGKLVKN